MGMKIFFSQTTNQSRPRKESLGKSNKGQNLDQNINERRIVYAQFIRRASAVPSFILELSST